MGLSIAFVSAPLQDLTLHDVQLRRQALDTLLAMHPFWLCIAVQTVTGRAMPVGGPGRHTHHLCTCTCITLIIDCTGIAPVRMWQTVVHSAWLCALYALISIYAMLARCQGSFVQMRLAAGFVSSLLRGSPEACAMARAFVCEQLMGDEELAVQYRLASYKQEYAVRQLVFSQPGACSYRPCHCHVHGAIRHSPSLCLDMRHRPARCILFMTCTPISFNFAACAAGGSCVPHAWSLPAAGAAGGPPGTAARPACTGTTPLQA